MEQGNPDASLTRYIPGLSNVWRQGKTLNIVPKRCTQHQHIVIKKTLEFTIELPVNTHTNYSSMCIVLPIQIKKSKDKTENVNVITVNNFFFVIG